MNGRFFTPRQKAIVYGVAAASATSIFYLPIHLGLYEPSFPMLIPTNQLTNSLLGVGLLVLCVVIGFVEDLECRWRKGIEKGVPHFIRDLIDCMRAGFPFAIALKECAKNRYGPLSNELNRVVVKMMLGFDPEVSISDIAKRVKTPLMDKVTVLLVEVMRSGARALHILQSFLAFHSTLESYEAEKESELRPYMWIMYISFVVYLIMVYVLITQFMIPLASAQELAEIAQAIINVDFYRAVFFYCGVIEAVAAGLAIGKISKGVSLTGLRHSALMLAILILVFTQFM